MASAAGLGYHAALTQDEAQVLSLVNGRVDIGRILELSYTTNFETSRILWALLLVGAIAPMDDAAEDERDRGTGEDYALAELVEEYAGVFTAIHGFVSERLGDLVDHFMDRVIELVVEQHPDALREVSLRNQGRVDYEQLLANLRALTFEARRDAATRALRELLVTLLDFTVKELGPDEGQLLITELKGLTAQYRGVPLQSVLHDRELSESETDD